MIEALDNKPALKAFLVSITGAVMLLWRAIAIGYPLVHYDTGAYIAACFDHWIPMDRPVTYSWFLRHFSLHETLWIPVIIQSLAIAWVLFLMFRYAIEVRRPVLWYFSSIIVLSATTNLSVHSAQLIADIFNPVMVAGAALILFCELPKRTKYTLSVVVVYSLTMHLSNYPLFCGLIGLVFIAWMIKGRKVQGFPSIRKIAGVAAFVPIAIVVTMLINRTQEPVWKFSPGIGHVMMVNRLYNCGIMDDYLDKTCGAKHYSLCDHRDRASDLLWDPESPLCSKYGTIGPNWRNAKPEYDSIISEIFSQSEYVKWFFASTLRDFGNQLLSYEVEYVERMDKNSSTYGPLIQHLPGDATTFLNSDQAKELQPFFLTNKVIRIVIPFSVFVLLLLFLLHKRCYVIPAKLIRISWFLAGAVVLNALTVATFAMVCTRFQSRIIWLLPLLMFLVLAQVSNTINWRKIKAAD